MNLFRNVAEPAAASPFGAEFDAKVAPLVARRDTLQTRLAEIDAKLAQISAERTQQLIDGNDDSSPSEAKTPLLEERESVANAIGVLSGRIATMYREKSEADARAQRALLEQALTSAEAVHAEIRARFNKRLGEFVCDEFPGLDSELFAAELVTKTAAEALGRTWSSPSRYATPLAANIGQAILTNRRIDRGAFGPVK